MRIVIDMQGAQNESRFRGIGRYSMDFVTQFVIEAKAKNIEIILALNGVFTESIEPLRAAFDAHLDQRDIQVWDSLSPVLHVETANDARRHAAECIREAFLYSLNPDVLLLTEFFTGAGDESVTSIGAWFSKIPTAVVLYDLIPLVYGEDYLSHPPVKRWYLDKLAQLKKADLLLAISDFTRNEGIKYLECPPDKIINMSSATNFTVDLKGADKASLLEKFAIEHEFVLYCGGVDPRKNLKRLLEARALLSESVRAQSQLVLAGKMPAGHVEELRQYANYLGIRLYEIVFTGYLSDEDLFGLYRCARGFVFPSYCEGFGLPALEAMMFDLPVIGSNISSIPEVIANPQALFDPFDPHDMSRLMALVLTDDAYCQRLVAHAQKQREVFSWVSTARIALDAMVQRFSPRVAKKPNQISEALLVKNVARELGKGKTRHEDMLRSALAIDHILPRAEQRRVLYVDISELHERDSKSGVQRVVRSVLKNLLTMSIKGFVVKPVYGTSSTQYRIANRWLAKYKNKSLLGVEDEVLDARHGDVFLGLDLQHFVTVANEPFLTQLRHKNVKVYFVVYDLLPILMPEVFPFLMLDAHTNWLQTLAKFDGVFAISRAVADEVVQWLATQEHQPLRPLMIDWFHLGADIDDSEPTRGLPNDATRVLEQLNLRLSFLMVGTIEPRKRQRQALAAFNQLWAQGVDVNLVMVGKQGWEVDDLMQELRQHDELGKRLFWLDGISDEYLDHVYAASNCLIAASKGEGFGLPLIEAAQHGLPIIARDIPVFREVAGEFAFYFSGFEAGALTSAIKNWLSLAQKPQSTGMPWLTWQQSTQQLVEKLLQHAGVR